MSHLIALRVPDEVMAKLAQEENLSLAIVRILRGHFGVEVAAVSEVKEAVRPPRKARVKVVPEAKPAEVVKEPEKPEKPAAENVNRKCYRCGGKTVLWGTCYRCIKCGVNY